MDIPGRLFQDGETVLSDWFGRGGDNAIFRAQLLKGGTSGDILIEIWTKSEDDPGEGNKVGTTGDEIHLTATMSAATVASLLIESEGDFGLKDLIRYRIICSGGWMDIRILMPVFFDSSKQIA